MDDIPADWRLSLEETDGSLSRVLLTDDGTPALHPWLVGSVLDDDDRFGVVLQAVDGVLAADCPMDFRYEPDGKRHVVAACMGAACGEATLPGVLTGCD